jgi:hypothetical protein
MLETLAVNGLTFLVMAATWIAIPFTLLAVAGNKGRSEGCAFLFGLFLPIPAVIYYMAVPSLRS